MTTDKAALADLANTDAVSLVRDWLKEAASLGGPRSAVTVQAQTQEADRVFAALRTGLAGGGDAGNYDQALWGDLRSVVDEISKAAAARGATAAETSAFIMALKRPLFEGLQVKLGNDAKALASATWTVSTLVDKMSQTALATYQRSREDIITRQQEELLELSTPVVKLWEGVLAVPMIGTLDSNRTQLVMESLLQRIVETGSEMAIIDITGVPTVDTLVAQHLLKTVTAIRLMGADCIISGIRPQIAQTIVHLGIDLQGITTKATLADALSLAIKRGGYVVTRQAR